MPATRDVIERIVIEHVEAENARDMDWVMRTYAADPVFDDVPSGALFEGKGVTPDLVIERTPEILADGRDPALEQLARELKRAAR